MKGASGVSVLIAVDDRSTRNVYRFLLGVAGYSAIEAPNARTAIDVLQTHPAGMVALLDWEMTKAGCMRILRGLAHAPDVAARHRYVLLARAPDTLHDRLLSLPASLSISLLRRPATKAELLAAVGAAARALPPRPSGETPA